MADFLERLGLDARADARAIRSAYARQLKLIDQHTDAAAFQSLREAYEGALRQLEGGVVATPPAPAAQMSVAQPQTADIPVLMRRLRDALTEFGGGGDAMQQRLRVLLQDLRPLNLDAAEAFEAGIAGILDEGWRPGSETLFAVAWREFRWNGRTLPKYIEQFHLLEGAIHDLRFLQEQPEAQREVYQRVMATLREPGETDLAQIARDITPADYVVKTFPDLAAVVSVPGMVAQWHMRMSAILGQVQVEAEARPEVKTRHPMERAMYYLLGFMGLLFCLAMLDMKFDVFGLHPRKVHVLTVMEMQHITRRIPRMEIVIPVAFNVTINEHGMIDYVERFDSSGPSVDAAVIEAAIRGAAPYPAEYPRQFRVQFPI